MMELIYYRPDYVIEDVGSGEQRAEDAHRTMRTAFAVGQVLGVSADLRARARQAIERIESVPDDERRLDRDEVAALAALTSEVKTALDAALDAESRPQGSGGERIRREAARPTELGGVPDPDRVFECHADGQIGLLHPRMSLYDFQQSLPELVEFLLEASRTGKAVVVDG